MSSVRTHGAGPLTLRASRTYRPREERELSLTGMGGQAIQLVAKVLTRGACRDLKVGRPLARRHLVRPDERNAMGSTKVSNVTAEAGHFGPRLFGFLTALRANNNREWFQAHKDEYESEVKEPMLQFIAAFGERLRTISRHFDADPRPMGGSMYRIYRDTRFAKDKDPIQDSGRRALPTQPWRQGRACTRVLSAPGARRMHGRRWVVASRCNRAAEGRDRIVTRTKDWKAIVDHGLPIGGDSLKRPPAGYDAAHPFIEDLKRKDIYTMTHFSDADVCGPDFLERYTDACRTASPLVKFLTKSLGLAW